MANYERVKGNKMRNVVDYDRRKYGRDEYGNLYLKSRKNKKPKLSFLSVLKFVTSSGIIPAEKHTEKQSKENKPCLCKVLCDIAKSMSHKPADCNKCN